MLAPALQPAAAVWAAGAAGALGFAGAAGRGVETCCVCTLLMAMSEFLEG